MNNPVGSALQETGRTFRDILSHEAEGRVSRANLGLGRAKLGYDVKKRERDIYMETPMSVENIIDSFPGLTDDQRETIRGKKWYGDMVGAETFTTPGNMYNAYNKTMELKKEDEKLESKQKREDTLLKEERDFQRDTASTQSTFRTMEKEDELRLREELGLGQVGARKATGLTTQQALNLRHKTYTETKKIDEAFEKNNPKPYKPASTKKMPKYNQEMRAWTLAKEVNKFKQMTEYYSSVFGESAGGQINQKAMTFGRKFYREISKIKDEKEQEVYAGKLFDASPELYAAFEAIDEANTQGVKTEKPKPDPVKEPPPAIKRKPTTQFQKDRAKAEAAKKRRDVLGAPFKAVGRGLQKLGNRPVEEEELGRYSRQSLR